MSSLKMGFRCRCFCPSRLLLRHSVCRCWGGRWSRRLAERHSLQKREAGYFPLVVFRRNDHTRPHFSPGAAEDWCRRCIDGGAMQPRHLGGIGDFGKFALLRHLMKDRRLAVCWYLTGENEETADRERHFDFLRHPDDFRHLAPEVFDQLAEFPAASGGVVDPFAKLQASGMLGNAVFIRHEVPKRVSLRRPWIDELVASVRGTNLVFLDRDHGIEGERLTNKHVALTEIAALRLPGRALIIGHRQSGRKSEVKFLADRMRSLGCDPVEIIRLRLVTSRLYIIADHDSAMTELIATFVRKWGNRIKSY